MFPEISEDKILVADIALKQLKPIHDLYKDKSTFFKSLHRPPLSERTTASPFNDSSVKLLVKMEIDDQVVYDGFEPEKAVIYDLEGYHMPAVLRRVLKQTKLNEVMEITSTRTTKLLDHLDDPQGVFSIGKMKQFKDRIKLTIKLLAIEYKVSLYKVEVAEKLKRLNEMRAIIAAFDKRVFDDDYIFLQGSYIDRFKLNDLKKAEKLCVRINRYYRNRDAKNNFSEEDTDTLEYRNTQDEIDEVHIQNYHVHSKLLQKQNRLGDALHKIQECLNKIDHRHFETIKLKIQLLKSMHNYPELRKTISSLREIFADDKAAEINALEKEINDHIKT